MKGAEIIIKVLEQNNIDTVFGYPGGTILNVYDELYKNGTKIKHYLTAHEQGAVHAADGYARSTGKVGVCFATSGPGATNLVTGLATAYMDSIPLVAITCNVNKSALGKDSFQEVDITGITMPITKHNFIVERIEDLEETVNEAFYIAKNGRCGPVLIDIPKNITAEECEYKNISAKETVPQIYDISALDRVVSLIAKYKRIFIMSGGGVIASGASEEIMKLSNALKAPIATTLMGNGSVPFDFENYTGMIGMHGTARSNMAAAGAQLIIAVGTRFSDRVATNPKNFAKNKKIVHIDLDIAETGKNLDIEEALIGDAKLILKKLNKKIEEKDDREFLDKCFAQYEEKNMEYENINPYFVMKEISRLTESKNVIITTEVGQHQMWAARYFNYREPRSLVTSGGLGTMGFGTGAAIGAQLANPSKRVFAIAGDGSFRMNSIELATISYYSIPVIIVIMNNKTLGMVRQWQRILYKKRYSETTLTERGPDFVKLADAYGIKGRRVENKEEFSKAIREAYLSNEPYLIDVDINIDESIYPMVLPGSTYDKMILDQENESRN